MSEEEKEAIEYLKEHNIPILKYDIFGNLEKIPYYGTLEKNTILNLIEKQQKEIEELKQPKYAYDTKTGTFIMLKNDFISKDKIKEKIKELKEIADEDNLEEYAKIDVLKEMLEE